MADYNAILQITDGTTTFDLLPWLKDWTPSLPGLKGGGTFLSGVFSDGRRPVLSNFDNAVETFYLIPNGTNQDGVINKLQTLRQLLQKGREYWTTSWQDSPVYIAARGSRETNTRYAVIVDWSMPNEDNPYAQPFYSKQSAMQDVSLILEHEHWQDNVPGEASCVLVNNIEAHPTSITADNYAPTASTDDGYVNLSWRATVSTGGGNITMGYNVNPYGGAVRFRNVDIPAGATIHSAKIYFYSIGNYSTSANLRIYIQDTLDPAALSNYTDFIARSFASNPTVSWSPESWTTGNAYTTPDISALIEYIMAKDGWDASTNDILIYIKDDPSNPSAHPGYRDAASFDNVTYTEPILAIDYSTADTSFGRSDTCNNEVYVTSHHTHNQIDTVKFYDDSLTSWTTRTIGDSLPYDITAQIPVSDDIIYFGISSSQADYGPFSGLVFCLASAMTGVTAAEWQYWDGAAWQTIDTVCDNTSGKTGGGIPLQQYSANGNVCSVHWEQPDDWAATTVDGVVGWFVRVYITTGSGAGGAKVTQASREVYAITTPYIDISSTSITGDLPATMQLKAYIQSVNDQYINNLYLTSLMVGLRSYNRGADFTPYVNMSQHHNNSGITVIEQSGSLTADGQSPSGYSLQYTPSGVESNTYIGYIHFTESIAEQYQGKFRAFLRVRQTGGSAGDLSVRLSTYTGVYIRSDVVPTNMASQFDLLDMGVVTIPLGTAYLRFYLDLTNTNAANPSITVYDFILMPTDEWSGEFYQDSYIAWNDHYFDVDSVTNLKETVYCKVRNDGDDSIYTPLMHQSSGEMFLQSNSRQRLWFLAHGGYMLGNYYRPYPEVSFSVQVFAAKRYFSMRGSG